MKRIALAVAAFVVAIAAHPAWAVPTALYHPPSGSLYLRNDLPTSLAAVAVVSATNSFKTDANLFAVPPGAIIDPYDLPLGIAYLTFPSTNNFPQPFFGHFVGSVVNPGTPISDLDAFYYLTFSNPVKTPFAMIQLPIPEPATSALAFLGVAGMIGRMVVGRPTRHPTN